MNRMMTAEHEEQARLAQYAPNRRAMAAILTPILLELDVEREINAELVRVLEAHNDGSYQADKVLRIATRIEDFTAWMMERAEDQAK